MAPVFPLALGTVSRNALSMGNTHSVAKLQENPGLKIRVSVQFLRDFQHQDLVLIKQPWMDQPNKLLWGCRLQVYLDQSASLRCPESVLNRLPFSWCFGLFLEGFLGITWLHQPEKLLLSSSQALVADVSASWRLQWSSFFNAHTPNRSASSPKLWTACNVARHPLLRLARGAKVRGADVFERSGHSQSSTTRKQKLEGGPYQV